MGDSWEDEDYTPIVIPGAQHGAQVKNNVLSNWDDEEEEEEKEKEKEMSEEQAAKSREREEKARLLAFHKAKAVAEAELYANETSEERKLRERRQVELADVAIASDLFNSSKANVNALSTQGGVFTATELVCDLNALKLESGKDFTKFSSQVATRFKQGKAKGRDIVSFLKNVLSKSEGAIHSDDLSELLQLTTSLRDEKVKRAAEKLEKDQAFQKKKKQQIQESKKHSDLFGGDFNDDKYQDYLDIEDDFM